MVLCEMWGEPAFDLFTNGRFGCHVSCSFNRRAVIRTLLPAALPEGDVLRQRNLLPQHNTSKRPFQVRSNSDVSEPMPRKQFPANIVGPQIRKARYQLGFSQEQLATRCQLLGLDISRSTLAQIEIRVRFVSDEELLVLASVLGVTTDDLFPRGIRAKFISALATQTRSRSKSPRGRG
jgi:DNA-binding XRE family transcriptional regulator